MLQQCFTFLSNQTIDEKNIEEGTLDKENGLKIQVWVWVAGSIFVFISNMALIFGIIKAYNKLTLSQKLYVYLSALDTFYSIDVMVVRAISGHAENNQECLWFNGGAIGFAISSFMTMSSMGAFLVMTIIRRTAI